MLGMNKKDRSKDVVVSEPPAEQPNQLSSQIRIVNNEEKISNSSSPIEKENLQRQEQETIAGEKIELNVEMTEEMKRQEQSVNFGASFYSQKSYFAHQNGGMGFGLNCL